MRIVFVPLLLLFASGCLHTHATGEQLARRAAFDLQCDEQALTVVELDDRTRGVAGCGQRVTYVEQCKPCANGYVGCECTWLLNGDGRSEQTKEAARTSPADSL